MGDRRSFFRFWPSSSAPTSRRRASSAQPTAPPRTTTSASQPPPPPPKPKPKSSPSSSSSSTPSPSRNASRASKPNQSPSPSRLSPKSKSTPNASPSRKDSQTPSTPPQRASPSRSPKPKAHEQDHVEHQRTETTKSEGNRRDEMEISPSKSSEFDARGQEAQPVDKDNSSNIEDELKPSMEVKASRDQEIEEVKEVSREETKGLPNNDEVAKQETVDPKQGTPSKNEFTSDTRKRSVRVNGKVAGSHKDDILNFVNHVMHKEGSSIEPLASVIILAGENRGASLQMGSSKGREGSVHIHRGYKLKSDEVFKENTDEEGSSKHNKTNEATKVMEDQHQPETYVNNNTQEINNSIVLNSSVTEKSPGVHLTIAQVPNEDAKELKEKGTLTESKKAEFSMNRAETLVHEPRIRRRCLKRLMLETSDSDEGENPEKPRRHGCRVACKEATM